MEKGGQKLGLYLLIATTTLFVSSIVYPIETHATKLLPGDFSTFEYSQKTIQQAGEKILTAEKKLQEAKDKGFGDLTGGDRSFIEDLIKKLTDRLELATKEFEQAKQYLEDQNYSKASSIATTARERAGIVIINANKILEGRTADTWNRLGTVLTEQNIISEGGQKRELIIAPKEGYIKEVFIIPGEDIIIKDAEKEFIVPKEGFKTVVSVEYGEDKIKEVVLESIGEKTVIKIITGATPADCDAYQRECKLGDARLCTKWETNCITTPPASQCDSYLKKCKLDDAESCAKWDSSCKALEPNKCSDYSRECKLGDTGACGKWDLNCKEVSVDTKESIAIRENKIYVNEKEVKIMPDTASEIAIAKLETLNFDMELKDVGRLVYDVSSEKSVKVLGLFRAKMTIKTQIDAETGEAGEIRKPWWSFFAR